MQQQQFFLRSYNCDKEIFLLDLQHYCPVKILDLEINRVDHHPLGR